MKVTTQIKAGVAPGCGCGRLLWHHANGGQSNPTGPKDA